MALKNIFEGLVRISRFVPVVLPLHPRTRKVLSSSKIKTDGLLIIEPVGYFDMLYLLQHCGVVVTDSGGLQKEAYFFNKHCLTLIDYTPWLELVQYGVNTTVGVDPERIFETAMCRIKGLSLVDFPAGLFGDGLAGEKIVSILAKASLN